MSSVTTRTVSRLARPCQFSSTISTRRAISTTTHLRGSGDLGPDRTHLHDKGGSAPKSNVQASSSRAAHDERADSAAGVHAQSSNPSQATSQKDTGNHNERAKKDHPEAPDVVIGMNDERGGKGH